MSKLTTGGQKLFEIIFGMRNFGVGAKVTRSIYKFPETYWVIKRVKIKEGRTYGKAWGELFWRGVSKGETKIGSVLKKQWKLHESSTK
mmetsp:Transcript_4267/g.6382  ORF Transcript_4267/g.6382 Transcript_4267/m.6382 type:complete len:88 (+) Transcript_4267:83-346(+)